MCSGHMNDNNTDNAISSSILAIVEAVQDSRRYEAGTDTVPAGLFSSFFSALCSRFDIKKNRRTMNNAVAPAFIRYNNKAFWEYFNTDQPLLTACA